MQPRHLYIIMSWPVKRRTSPAWPHMGHSTVELLRQAEQPTWPQGIMMLSMKAFWHMGHCGNNSRGQHCCSSLAHDKTTHRVSVQQVAAHADAAHVGAHAAALLGAALRDQSHHKQHSLRRTPISSSSYPAASRRHHLGGAPGSPATLHTRSSSSARIESGSAHLTLPPRPRPAATLLLLPVCKAVGSERDA